MIIEEALPDIPEQGWRSPASSCKHEKEFRGTVLRIATTSRSLLTIVYDMFELLDHQDFRLPAIRTKSTSHVVYRGTKGSVNSWHFVLRTVVSLTICGQKSCFRSNIAMSRNVTHILLKGCFTYVYRGMSLRVGALQVSALPC